MSAPVERVQREFGLSALVVNYNTGAFAVGCVRSLLEEWTRAGRERERLQIVVIDNASQLDQEPYLAEIEALGGEVIRHDENAGYAKGMNLCFARTSGEPDDYVAILNPDIYFLPGSVEKLVAYLEQHPECGAIDPHTCIDPLGVFHLPRNLLPTVVEHLRIALATVHPVFSRSYSRFRTRKSLQWWLADEPIQTDMLSGCCVFMHRRVAEERPALFDERYPLYYEDTDLFRTLRGRGYRLVHCGDAHILHHWSRSAQPGGAFGGELLRRYRTSEEVYFRKYYGRLGWWVVAALEALERALPHRAAPRPIHPVVDLGSFREPPEIRLPRSCRFLLEMTDEPTWLLTIGVVGEGDRWVCPAESWQWFFDIRYFVRALDVATLEVLGAWTFVKETPGRQEPLEGDEMDAIFRNGRPAEQA